MQISQRVLIVGALALLATPRAADAQLGWVKRLLGKKGAPPPAAAPAPQVPGAVGAPVAGVPPAAGGVVATTPQQAAQQAAAAAADSATRAAAAEQKAERERNMTYGRGLDQQEKTLDNAKARLNFWEGVKLSFGADAETYSRFEAARRDLEQLKQEDSVKKATDAKSMVTNAKLERATSALRARTPDDAISVLDDVLSTDPTNQRALQLREQARALQKARRLKITLFALGGAALVLFGVFAVLAKKIFKKEKAEGEPKVAAGAAVGKAYVKVVDGVGRGKLVAIKGDVFRIGAVAGGEEEDRNDLVVSDSLAAVSRFHCSILRKGRDYFLIDSSLNGTRLNDRVLDRGENKRLRDGDEFSLADVTRLKFVKT